MSKTIQEELERVGLKARKRGKRWPRKRGHGRITIVIENVQFKPGTGFAIRFLGKDEK